MDALHAKAVADLCLKVDSSENEFYSRHSCDWLHLIKSTVTKKRKSKAHKVNDPAAMAKSVEL